MFKSYLSAATLLLSSAVAAQNPLFVDVFTADPAALVDGDTVYLYTGHDEAKDNNVFFEMHDWLVFSSKDMKHWTPHGAIMQATDFSWAKGEAWAAHMVKRKGKYYFYTTVRHKDDKPGFAIGVAVSDSPTGPFKDALGKALVTDDMTKQTPNDWDDIDPAIYIEENGDVYMFFGNLMPKYVKLKDNMIELDGEIKTLDLPKFTEAAWVHKKDDNYYLSYACEFPEKICYAMSKSIHGPWEYKGILNEIAGNSETNHQSIIEFKGKSYFIYHTGAVPPLNGQPSGGRFRRSVAIDALNYNADGSLKRIIMTSEGIN
ncbi:MAG: glycoside hydrolase family 43 protein [Paraglaciecola sp.]|uniref:glycoside hydrolase family 43 protein n=1 Tax=Pseudomonadati TaxID=3379134 RepID=UPI00273DA953|nr:glycoside hydrolase family 43 protein [Paraglaciecola sp.]MDP5030544.1 glycoside hydrolase family 43 protein [Paraglaciecola sp.]MDP5131553.1 glycoside hydrolase family 43 protein [Paraglaciecola sp.]